jgi:hypothetical protein
MCNGLRSHSISIIQPNPELIVEFTNPNPAVVCNHANHALSNIPYIIVVVQQFDMLLDSFRRRMSARCYYPNACNMGGLLEILSDFLQLGTLFRYLGFKIGITGLYGILSFR